DMAREGPGALLALAYTPENAEGFFRELAPDYMLLPQCGADLGERMDLALRHFLDAGCERVALVGSDIPLLEPLLIERGFDELDAGAQAVFGPAEDGGYYLIARAPPQPALLLNHPMSSPTVLPH